MMKGECKERAGNLNERLHKPVSENVQHRLLYTFGFNKIQLVYLN